MPWGRDIRIETRRHCSQIIKEKNVTLSASVFVYFDQVLEALHWWASKGKSEDPDYSNDLFAFDIILYIPACWSCPSWKGHTHAHAYTHTDSSYGTAPCDCTLPAPYLHYLRPPLPRTAGLCNIQCTNAACCNYLLINYFIVTSVTCPVLH